MSPLEKLQEKVVHCTRCPRLLIYCTEIGKVKKREFRDQAYWAKPVPGFGDPKAQIWIIGLAPAAHGANRTGRMFTGDSSGRWLFEALSRQGFSDRPESLGRADGLRLNGVYISATARCAPPDNKPLPEEIAHCSSYLDEEYRALSQVKVFLPLGKIAFDATLNLLQRQGIQMPSPRPKFAHGAYFEFGERRLLASYHPSRQNTQTGRLTKEMWNAIFAKARSLIESKNHSARKGKFVRPFSANDLNVPGSLREF